MATVSIPRISDNQLMRVFINETLCKKEEFGFSDSAQVNINIASTSMVIRYDMINDDGSIADELLEGIRQGGSVSCSITTITLTDGTKQNFTFTYRRAQGSLIDSLETTNQALRPDGISMLIHLESKLQSKLSASTTGEVQSDVFAAHHEVLTKLEGLNASLIDKQQDFTRKLEAEKTQFLDEQQAKNLERQENLDTEFRAKQEQLESTYDKRHKELDEREKQIEDADNTTARRKTTTSMLTDVQEKAKRFNFSPSVTAKSNCALIFAIVLALAGAINAYWAVGELNAINTNYNAQIDGILSQLKDMSEEAKSLMSATLASGTKDQTYIWFLYVRVFFGSALFVSSTLYLIKWFNSWANRLAQQELDNQQFVRDLNRAHLAVEMCLEWNDKKDGGVPERLLNSLTEGLFQDKNQIPQDIAHPADQLASALVRSADKIKVPVGTGELEVNGKNLGKQKPPKPDKP
ncbi:conserved hypothetical protein [Vibrio crassostreae]|nr:conserved hypothetical protein [Vibrio crassostreae]